MSELDRVLSDINRKIDNFISAFNRFEAALIASGLKPIESPISK